MLRGVDHWSQTAKHALALKELEKARFLDFIEEIVSVIIQRFFFDGWIKMNTVNRSLSSLKLTCFNSDE